MSADDDWRTQAACAGHDTDLWYPEGRDHHTLLQIDAAKAICATCPVRLPCLDHALARDERGVWGGLTEQERQRRRQYAHPTPSHAHIGHNTPKENR